MDCKQNDQFTVMKKCTECGEEKPLTEYHKKVGRLRSNCRSCVSRYTRQHYAANKEYYLTKAAVNRKLGQQRIRKLLWDYKKEVGCVDCGELDPIMLEFDHLSGKQDGLASMATRALAFNTIIAEVEKCDVVCANCHRRRTSKKHNWYNINL